MAAEMADFEDGIRVETVLGADDVSSKGPSSPDENQLDVVLLVYSLYISVLVQLQIR